MRFSFLPTILIFLSGALLQQPALAANLASRPKPNPEIGRQAYLDNCTRCHGPTGAGDGRDADNMFPRPRPLSEGVFKFRTTASGTPPTDEDLFHTLSEGLPGSRMPDFQRLSEEIRWQLIYYVKSLTPVFKEQKPELIPLGNDPSPKKANLQRGRGLYTQLGCNACHGTLGRGDGPSAPTLVDQWNQPIQAADLTQGWSYRSGSSARDILTRLMTGLDGTPMPSYAEAVSAEEVWDLAYYVHSLQEKPYWGKSVEAVPVEGPLPKDASDSRWQAAFPTDLRLSSVLYKEGKVLPTRVNGISVQALYNGEEILFRLRWHDRVESRQSPSDAVALALLPELRTQWQIGSLRAWPNGQGVSQIDLCYWSAERNSVQQGVVSSIEPLEAGKGLVNPRFEGKAAYADGEWTLLLKRPLIAQGVSGVQLAPGQVVPFGVMVWEGSNQERGRHRANSRWINLILNPGT